jgi:hypothetical protein
MAGIGLTVVAAHRSPEQDSTVVIGSLLVAYIFVFLFLLAGSFILTVSIIFHLSLLMLYLFYFSVDHRHLFF